MASGAAPRASSTPTWRKLADALLSTAFEPPCAACGATLDHPLDGAICAGCWTAVAACARIEQRLSPSSLITWTVAVGAYDGRLKDIVHALKYERRRSISPRLGASMKRAATDLLRDAECAIPVPLHPFREYTRGFNQARDLAVHIGLPVVDALVRVKHTRSQIELAADERHANVAHAFGLRASSIHPPARVVVLVDDVSTTGATLESCARILREAGVQDVRALTAARVVTAPR